MLNVRKEVYENKRGKLNKSTMMAIEIRHNKKRKQIQHELSLVKK